ncbi:MAG: hypothetical protein IH865_07340 [Chloroflexi bacterium]|nr:hypothetical protein [Chloroflexota bacterium]
MAVEEQSESSLSMLDVAFKIVQATLATLAAYRAARSALKAWQGIVSMFRSDTDESSDEAA